MKIDKDFAVKVEGKVFTGNEIDKIVIDGGKFSMVCTYTNGSKFEVSAYTKDVELCSSVINLDINISTKEMKNAVKEAIEEIGISDPDPNIATEISRKESEKMRRFDCSGLRYMPCFKDENMEPAVSEEVVRKAVKEALEEFKNKAKRAGTIFWFDHDQPQKFNNLKRNHTGGD